MTVSLPRPADGGPFPDPMHWRPVVGGRVVEGSLPATRPVKCGNDNEDLYSGFDEQPPTVSVHCIDNPTPKARGDSSPPRSRTSASSDQRCRHHPGSTVTAAFIAKRSGPADPPTVFSLAAQTAIPGGTVSIDRSSISLSGDATQPVVATIGVPAGRRRAATR